MSEFYHIAVYSAVTVAIIGFLLLVAWWFGAKKTSLLKQMPYEAGNLLTANETITCNVPFYLIAIFFIVFDVEAAFIFTWASVWEELGMGGLIQITVFIIILVAGLVWLWIKGGLNWGPSAILLRKSHARTNSTR